MSKPKKKRVRPVPGTVRECPACHKTVVWNSYSDVGHAVECDIVKQWFDLDESLYDFMDERADGQD